jgi:hypothetical protein
MGEDGLANLFLGAFDVVEIKDISSVLTTRDIYPVNHGVFRTPTESLFGISQRGATRPQPPTVPQNAKNP